MERKLTRISTNYGIMQDHKVNKLYYACQIKGTLTNPDKGFMAIVSDKDNNDDKEVNIVLYYDPEEDKVKKVLYKANSLFKGLNTSNIKGVSNNIKESIIKEANKLSNVYKKEEYTSIDAKDYKAIIDTSEMKSVLKTIEDYGKQLEETLISIKKEMTTSIEGFLERYEFREHVLLVGSAGFSKTYTATQYIKDKGYISENVIGHEAIESIDLLGYYTRTETGDLVWMDGALTAAFRKAKDNKVVLFIDEILRIPSKELNILVGSLTPNSSGEFVLRTNRIVDIKDGIGESETLIVPKENLWIISTTNIGSDYNVENLDKALNDRFVQLDIKPDDETIRDIIYSVGSSKFSETILDKLFEVYKLVKDMYNNKELTNVLNTRNIVRVLNNTTDPKYIKKYLKDLTPQIVNRDTDGNLNQVEVEIYEDIINSKF
jgi:hypothetical protein